MPPPVPPLVLGVGGGVAGGGGEVGGVPATSSQYGMNSRILASLGTPFGKPGLYCPGGWNICLYGVPGRALGSAIKPGGGVGRWGFLGAVTGFCKSGSSRVGIKFCC